MEAGLPRAVAAVPDDELSSEVGASDVFSALVDRFRLVPIELGESALDPTIERASVESTDPRILRPGERSRMVTVTVHTMLIPVGGDSDLLRFWPPDVSASEPSERNWLDPRTRCIRLPAYEDRSHPSAMARYLREQEALLRKLVDSTNRAVEKWNEELPTRLAALMERRRAELQQRAALRASLDLPERAATGTARPYRLPSAAPRAAAPKLERGDYPVLEEGDLVAVIGQIRRWADFILDHPSTVGGKGEEHLRDELLHSLNSRWPASAETFSRLGKTDIRVVVDTAHSSGISDVVFKAECKVYEDAGDVTEAFLPLTERYLTARETRTAIILFVKDQALFPKVRERAVGRLVERHGGLLLTDEMSGWPVLDVPHPEVDNWNLRVVVAVVDVSAAA